MSALQKTVFSTVRAEEMPKHHRLDTQYWVRNIRSALLFAKLTLSRSIMLKMLFVSSRPLVLHAPLLQLTRSSTSGLSPQFGLTCRAPNSQGKHGLLSLLCRLCTRRRGISLSLAPAKYQERGRSRLRASSCDPSWRSPINDVGQQMTRDLLPHTSVPPESCHSTYEVQLPHQPMCPSYSLVRRLVALNSL